MNAETIGGRELAAWLVAPGLTWVQTRSPQFARKLSQRSDSRLVARGVAGGYLRTFEFQQSLAWARRLIARYTTANVMPTNSCFSSHNSSVVCRKVISVTRQGAL